MAPYPHMPVSGTAYTAPNLYTNAGASAILMGSPVYSSAAGSILPAIASSLSTSLVIGLVGINPSILAGASGPLQRDDIIAMATTLWDAIAGTSGGLTFGTVYYLSPTTAGALTATAPTTRGQCVVPLIIGNSPTQATVKIGQPVLL